jgi:hypothetical protein
MGALDENGCVDSRAFVSSKIKAVTGRDRCHGRKDESIDGTKSQRARLSRNPTYGSPLRLSSGCNLAAISNISRTSSNGKAGEHHPFFQGTRRESSRNESVDEGRIERLIGNI